MSSFQIYQDAEKENPTNLKGMNVGTAALKHKNHKLALRQVGSNNKSIKDANVVPKSFGQKKATVVPVVEQFKTFSVYEDKTENEKGHHVVASNEQLIKTAKSINSCKATTSSSNTASHLVKIDEENQLKTVHLESERQYIGNKSDLDGHIDHESVFNTTPMSVSDILSPMSIDRSNISTIDIEDKENQADLLQQLQQQQQENEQHEQKEQQEKDSKQQQEQDAIQIPRNDRQRFFEVVEYQMDILEYFRESEKKHLPKPHYMRRQQDINYSMRTILVDWLVEVSEEYNLDTETLYLSISYIDRFLSHMSVVRNKLQLVGTAAMYIAAKYEEIYPPDVGEFVFITDDTYTKAQVLRMEQLILKILSFDLCTPTPYVFVNTYAVLTDMTCELKSLTMYICELSLLEADPYLRYTPSLISAASHALARYILDYVIWTAHLEEITKYTLEDLKEVFLRLCKTHKAALTSQQQAIQEKYKGKKYNAVATRKPVELTSEQYDEITSKYNEVAALEKASLEQQQQSMMTTNNENMRRMISLMFN